MRRTLLIGLLLLLVPACAGAGANDPAGSTVISREKVDTTKGITPLKAVTGPDGECRHVYEQVGVHPFERMVDGLPQVELCVVNRCVRCGKVVHECERYR